MPRLATPSFAEDNQGNLFIARGDRSIQRWNGLTSSLVDAGLTAPANTITLGVTGTGLITGNIFAYQRVVDSEGRVSNLSALSDELVITGSTKTVTDASNATPIAITCASHGYSTNDKVKITGIQGNRGANGTWVITVSSSSVFTLNGSSGTGAYVGGGTIRQGVSQIDYTNLGVISDTRVAKRQILRNKDGDLNVFYVDQELTNLSTTSVSSTKDEDDLGAAVVLLDANGNDLNVTRHAEPPNYKKVIVNHYSRLFALVDYPYKEGNVAVTNASTTVTGVATAWTAAMAGWELFVNGDATTSYTVSAVNTSAQTLTISAYGGTTDPYATYVLRPARSATGLTSREERRTLYYSEIGLPDSFNLNKAITLSEDDEAGEMTGGMPIQTRFYILFENRIYRLAYTSEPSDGNSVEASWRGCVNNNCWQIVEESAYLMDRQGIFIFSGNYYEPISESIQPLFERDTGHKYRINWDYREHFFSTHDPRTETIRWFVSLGGERLPRHSLRYHYRLKIWTLEEWPVAMTAACVGVLNGQQAPLWGASARRVIAPGIGHLDGVRSDTGNTLRGTVTASDVLSFTDSTATFSTALPGLPVYIVAGTGRGQMRIISARSSATKLVIDHPWTTKPDTTSTYQLGGIKWKYRSGWFRFYQGGTSETRGFELMFRPTTETTHMAVRRYFDNSSTARVEKENRSYDKANGLKITTGDADILIKTTKSSGIVKHDDDGYRAVDVDGMRYVRIEWEGVTSTEGHALRNLILHGALQGGGGE